MAEAQAAGRGRWGAAGQWRGREMGRGPRGRCACSGGGEGGGWAGAAAGLGQNLQREGNSLSLFFIKSDLQTILQNKFQTILNPNKTWDHLELVFRLF